MRREDQIKLTTRTDSTTLRYFEVQLRHPQEETEAFVNIELLLSTEESISLDQPALDKTENVELIQP